MGADIYTEKATGVGAEEFGNPNVADLERKI